MLVLEELSLYPAMPPRGSIPHSHGPDLTEIEEAKVRERIKHRALNSFDKPRQIRQEIVAPLPTHVAIELPTSTATSRMVNRVRNNDPNRPKEPNTRGEIVVEEIMEKTIRGEHFLLLDTGVDDPLRIIAWATADNLRESAVWLMGGTFKVRPKVFTQLYTIHGSIGNKTFPLVYALLPNKTSKTYERLFNGLQSVMQSRFSSFVGPRICIIDFEMAAKVAFEKVFPSTKMSGEFLLDFENHQMSNVI